MTNNYETLKKKLAAGEKVSAATLAFFDEPTLIERMKRADLDFILFDMEHGRYNPESIRLNLDVCRLLDIPSVVRVPDVSFHMISKTIDSGADGIMLPRVETAEQLRTAVDAVYLHPIGRKGFGGPTLLRKDESVAEFQEGRILMPQIESPAGADNLPALLEAFGERVSGIIVGPFDFSVALGTPGDVNGEALLAAYNKVIGICKRHNKSVGIYCRHPEDAALYRKLGANIFWMSSDLDIYMDGYNRAFDALAKIK